MSSDNKMLDAYRHLLESAKEAAFKAEQATWETLGKAIDQAEQKFGVLEVLSDQEMLQVQNDLKADLNQIAETLTEFEQGVEHFIEMEWPTLEGFLAEKALELADPTELMILRMRMMAAMQG